MKQKRLTPLLTAKKRRAMPGRVNAKLRHAIKSMAGQAFGKKGQKAAPQIRKISLMRSAVGETAGEILIKKAKKGRIHSAEALEALNLDMGTAAVRRIISASPVIAGNKETDILLGPTAQAMHLFEQNVPRENTLWKYTKKPLPVRNASITIYKASIMPGASGKKPDAILRIANAIMKGVDFNPPRVGARVNEYGKEFTEMSRVEQERTMQPYTVLGYILFHAHVAGRGPSYHAMAYLKKLPAKK